MSILFVLLMFLLIMSISYLRHPESRPVVQAGGQTSPQPPRLRRELGFQIPEDYCFHPGHTWALKESPELARIGVDTFTTNLLGKIDRVEVVGPNRWVRQGQKFMTVYSGETSVDLLSPVEGVVMAVNSDVLTEPDLLARDPYKNGWVATVKSPDLAINQKNLVQGPMVASWLQNSITRLNGILAQLSPALAQDGGQPLGGALGRLEPELKQRVIQEFFLS